MFRKYLRVNLPRKSIEPQSPLFGEQYWSPTELLFCTQTVVDTGLSFLSRIEVALSHYTSDNNITEYYYGGQPAIQEKNNALLAQITLLGTYLGINKKYFRD